MQQARFLPVRKKKPAPAGTADKIKEAKAKLEDGSLNVFDTANFTVGGKKVDTYTANVNSNDDDPANGKYVPDTEAVEGGISTSQSTVQLLTSIWKLTASLFLTENTAINK